MTIQTIIAQLVPFSFGEEPKAFGMLVAVRELVKRLRSILIATFCAFYLILQTNAVSVPITGTISYISAAVPNTTDLNLATSFSFFPSGIVVSATGDLIGVGPAVVNAPGISSLPLGTGPAPAAVPVLGLWSGGGFTFDLLSLNVDFRSAIQFTASGTGIITAAGFDATPATWTLAITGAGPVLGLSAGSESVQSVPDGGSSLLLGLTALAGLTFFRRTLKK